MTKDDITRMAREAGIKNDCDGIWCDADQLIAFAALVLANTPPQSSMAWQEGFEAGKKAERERIIAANRPEIEKINAHIKALEKAVEDEREACAKAAEEYMRECEGASFGIGEAIRARGNT